MKQRPDLAKAQLLIADGDTQMAEVLRHMLSRMGFTSVKAVKNGQQVLDTILNGEVDLLITEWEMGPMDGMTLLKTLRNPDVSPNLTLPVIMLTARAEAPDVVQARDTGVTEFVVKPFTSATLFARIRQVFDNPRGFVFSQHFVGPDRRRHRDDTIAGGANKRRTEPMVLSHLSAAQGDLSKPKMLAADHKLKKKVGILDSISSIITPQMLADAQHAIDAFRDEAQHWVGHDMTELGKLLKSMEHSKADEVLEDIKSKLLSIKSRAGTFGYTLASNIAFNFYSFMRNDFRIRNTQHWVIVNKHYDVLRVVLANNVLGEGGEMEAELARQLSEMTEKLKIA